MDVPIVNVHAQEAGTHRVLQVGHLHRVAVPVTPEELHKRQGDEWGAGGYF